MFKKKKKKKKKRKVANGETHSVHPRPSHVAQTFVGVGKEPVNIATNSGTLGKILSFVLVHSGSNHGP